MKEVLIKLYGKAEGNNEIIDFTTVGKMEIENNTVTIEYEETELSGMEGTTSKIIISEGAVTLNRVGQWTTTMAFVEGQETKTNIVTPHGEMKLSIFTNTIETEISENHMDLKLNYNFVIGGDRINNFLYLTSHTR